LSTVLDVLVTVAAGAGASGALTGVRAAGRAGKAAEAAQTAVQEVRSSHHEIVCDYLDLPSLRASARELGLPDAPTRIETTEEAETGGEVSLPVKIITLGIKRTKRKGQKIVRVPKFDPQALASSVVARLRESDKLHPDLSLIPVLPIAQANQALGALRDLNLTDADTDASIQQRLEERASSDLVAQKLRDFHNAYEDPRPIVVESVWSVCNGANLRLELAELRSQSAGVATMPLPDGLKVVVPLAAPTTDGIIYPRGTARLRPESRILAGVLGTIEPVDGGSVRITPRVIFDPRRG
jgi:hypothetical protein